MPDRRADLRATEESIINDAEHLKQLEATKAALDPGDPRVDFLSKQVERVVDGLASKAAVQRHLAAEIDAGR